MGYAELRSFKEPDDEAFIGNNIWSSQSPSRHSRRITAEQPQMTLTWGPELREVDAERLLSRIDFIGGEIGSTLLTSDKPNPPERRASLTQLNFIEVYFETVIWLVLFSVSVCNIVFGVVPSRFPLTSLTVAFGALPLAIISFRKARGNRHG